MRDIDQALAKGYATNAGANHTPRPISSIPPGPHFVVEAAPETRPVSDDIVLAWPETVRALERAHGDRFEALASALIASRDDRGTKVLLFTSCHRGEGRTTLVLALSRALARRPGRTLLVDGDLGGPMLARSLGIRPLVGLDDVVEHDKMLADALIEAPDDHLTILPLRLAVSRPREFLASIEWTRLMTRLRREFDLVLVDGGPLFAGMSASTLHTGMDAVVLVHHKARTSERTLSRATHILDDAGVPLLGLAETFC